MQANTCCFLLLPLQIAPIFEHLPPPSIISGTMEKQSGERWSQIETQPNPTHTAGRRERRRAKLHAVEEEEEGRGSDKTGEEEEENH